MTDAAYTRYLTDPRFAARVRERYRGRHDPADAVWWLTHPDQPGPSGARPPAEQRDALARRAYSREGAADPSLARALADLDAAIAADRGAIEAALAAPDDFVERPALPVAPVASPPAAATAPRQRTKRAPVGAVMIVALLIGAIGGAVITRAVTTADAGWTEQFDVVDSDEANPYASSFDIPAVASDLPRIAVSSRFDADSFRRLSRNEDEDRKPLVYVVRDTSNRFCAVLVVDDSSAASCVIDKYFPVGGMTVMIADAEASYTVTLGNDGSMTTNVAPLVLRDPAEQSN